MTGFNHTLAGSIIAVLVPAPLVPLVAFVSHFVLDALPHFGRHPKITTINGKLSRNFKRLLVLDAILCFAALFFAWWLFPNKWLIITVGAFFSALPDFLWLLQPRAKSRLARAFFRFATIIQWGERPWGWVLEIVYAAYFALTLLYLAS